MGHVDLRRDWQKIVDNVGSCTRHADDDDLFTFQSISPAHVSAHAIFASSKHLRSELLCMHELPLINIRAIILGHHGFGLVAMTKHYLVELLGPLFAIDKHV